MPDIIKTIEAYRDPERVRRWLAMYNRQGLASDHRFIFQLGRGRPKRGLPNKLWFTFQGKILGSFEIERIERNAGQFDRWFKTMFGDGYWLRPDSWLAVCLPPFVFLDSEQTAFHEGFRGWRYFDVASYRKTPEAMTRL